MNEDTRKSIRRQAPARIVVPRGQVRVLESHHAIDFQMALDAWPFHKICWVAIGLGHLETEERKVAIQAGDFLLLPAARAHRFIDKLGEPLTLVLLCISEQYLADSRSQQRRELWHQTLSGHVFGEPYCARTAFHQNMIVANFRLALREQGNRELGWETALEAVADRLLLAFGRQQCVARRAHRPGSWHAVEGAIEYINTHLFESLQIEAMAERSGLSPRRFTDLFKQITGQTFSHYLNRKRIEYARHRLDETGHILYACHESGFNDLAYFYRVFKKQTGMTPGAYLKSQRPRTALPK